MMLKTETSGDEQVMDIKVTPEQLPELQRRLNALNKRAAKLNRPPATADIGPIEVIRKEWKSGADQFVPVYGHRVILSDEPIRLQGWTFLAAIDHEDGHEGQQATIVREMPGQTLPAEYRDTPARCDHCNTNRRRVHTYIVKHDDGRIQVVGRQCLKDYLGGDPAQVIPVIRFWSSLMDELEDIDGEKVSRASHVMSLLPFLTDVAYLIRTRGWVPRSQASPETGKFSTADMALSDGGHDRTQYPDEPVDTEKAIAAIAWAEQLDARTTFEHNIRSLALAKCLTFKSAGFAAAIVSVHARHLDDEQKKKCEVKSEHYGAIKERIRNHAVTLMAMRSFDSFYGVRWMLRFQDDTGHVFVWWTTVIDERLERGVKFLMTGTIKAHETYQGTAQTIVTRCKLVC